MTQNNHQAIPNDSVKYINLKLDVFKNDSIQRTSKQIKSQFVVVNINQKNEVIQGTLSKQLKHIDLF
ncbi:unnamed protein product [Paramecium sonneborni]|uniref:Uncharacterized protein n=1 Tax=Paramecium sonneborni TaxID=65129 RepID=A0A8S1N896_9CILI|nr:unnamed protein product [Paramecium sonneborni]